MQSYLNFVIIPIVFLMFSCSQAPSKQIVDVSGVQIEQIQIERFDREFDRLPAESGEGKIENGPTLHLTDSLHQGWKSEYGSFYQDFIERMLGIGAVTDDRAVTEALAVLAQNSWVDSLGKSVEAVFPNLDAQEAQLNSAFQHIRYYLPEAPLPTRFIAFYSGFSFQIPVGKDYIGIGLDLFLGADSEYYPALIDRFPRYISRRFTPQHLIPRVMESYVYEYLLAEPEVNASFLDHMIYHGKALYLLDLVLPDVADSLKIGYTDKQLAWAQHFQEQVWEWMTTEELLYQTDLAQFNRHFSEAPFTLGLGEKNESAPKLGIYMGWQLIRRYMAQHPETDIAELLHQTDGQSILYESGFQGKTQY